MLRGGALRRDASNHVLLMSSINFRGMGDFAPNLGMLLPIFWQGIIRWGHYCYFEQIEKKPRGAPAYQVEYNFAIILVGVFVSGICFPVVGVFGGGGFISGQSLRDGEHYFEQQLWNNYIELEL